MDVLKKLEILGTAAKFDVCTASTSLNKRNKTKSSPSGICHSFTPDGRCISLLKVLLTNECQKDCIYCQNRCQRDIQRTHFTPDELVTLFMQFYTRNYVEGLFLSSGVRVSSNQTMQEMIKVAEILRVSYQFKGYIHLKILPGAEESLIQRAVELSNRVSVNLEVPNQKAMEKISQGKNFGSHILKTVEDISNKIKYRPRVSQTTQFIIGAAQETDEEIITSVFKLYDTYKLTRAYFSAFQPVQDTPLENTPPTPLIREHRLYQTDFLIRQYGFSKEEIFYGGNGFLDMQVDPKLAFAVKNRHLFPIEVNRASLSTLLKIPGIGPTSAKRIIQIRRTAPITMIHTLKMLGVVVKRAAPFILLNGKAPQSLEKLFVGIVPAYQQLTIEEVLQEGYV